MSMTRVMPAVYAIVSKKGFGAGEGRRDARRFCRCTVPLSAPVPPRHTSETEASSVCTLSASWSGLKCKRPMTAGWIRRQHRMRDERERRVDAPARTTPLGSPFQSKPPRASLIACSTSSVTVPRFTLGMRPLGPSVRASVGFRWKRERCSFVVMSLSGLIFPRRISSMSSCPPTMSAPACRAASACLPDAKTTIVSCFVAFAHEWGRKTRPRMALSWIVPDGLIWTLMSYARFG